MAMAFSESEFSAEEGKFEKPGDDLIDFLNTEDVDAKDIVYHGHLKDK
jgi:hypothetical protein